MSSGMASAATGSGNVTLSTVPAGSTSLALVSTRPDGSPAASIAAPTRTWPSLIRRCTCDRDSPASSDGKRLVGALVGLVLADLDRHRSAACRGVAGRVVGIELVVLVELVHVGLRLCRARAGRTVPRR